jgi:hypothetical protein
MRPNTFQTESENIASDVVGPTSTSPMPLFQDSDRTDNELTQIRRFHCSSQLPQHFQIVLLPNKIISWLTLLLRGLPAKQQLVETHLTTKLRHGIGTPSTATASDLVTILSRKECPKLTRSKFLEVLTWLFVKDNFLDHSMLPWLKSQLQIPSNMWL